MRSRTLISEFNETLEKTEPDTYRIVRVTVEDALAEFDLPEDEEEED